MSLLSLERRSTAPPPPAGAAARRGRALLTAVLVVVVGLLPVRAWVAEPVHVPTGSMAPTIRPGEHVLVRKLGYDAGSVRRGDVVAFERAGSLWVKRVVALPGDRVGLEDGRLVVNHRVVHESYADPDRIDSVYFGPVTVPAGRLFVMGDDRRDSRDSRIFGAIPAGSVRGQVVAVVWPWHASGRAVG